MKKLISLVTLVISLLASIASAQLPEGFKFDDGFTWFQCHNFETSENNVPKSYWVPEFSIRIWGKAPANSGLKLVLRADAKKVYEVSMDGYARNIAGENSLVVVGFWKDKDRIQASGMLTADFYYIDGLTNKEYLARSCKIDVRKVSRNRGQVGHRDPDSPAYYVNRHGEILSNILYFRDVEVPSYTLFPDINYFTERRVELVMNYSEGQELIGPRQGRIAVEVNGKPIEMVVPNNEVVQDRMGLGFNAGRYFVQHSDRDAQEYFKTGPGYKEYIIFARRSLDLPLEWGDPLPNRVQGYTFTTKYPGDWKVTYYVERVPVRIFRFKVDATGRPVPHEEQTKGLNLAPNAILVDTEIPGKGGEFDARLTNIFVKEGGFFGRPWATAKMKAAAAAVPTKGKPFPESSAKKG